MQNKKQNQNRWGSRSGRDSGLRSERQEKDKGKTGTGEKSSGKRQRCGIENCQAFASPSKSGFCSWHEQQITPVGELVADARKFKCRDANCAKPQAKGMEFCPECADRRFRAATEEDYDDVLEIEPL
jgi:hypothetical protein